MNIIVLETATEACSVAVQSGDKIVSEYVICPQQHSQRILPMLAHALSEAGLAKQDIDGIGFGHGPGSFTGVRIAMGMTQGLALGLDIPVVGVSTLGAMAQQIFAQQPKVTDVFAAIDARMDEVYFAHYRCIDNIAVVQGVEQVISPATTLTLLPNTLHNDIASGCAALVGTGWQAYPELSEYAHDTPAVLYPDARYMLAFVEQALAAGLGQAVEQVEPQYLRNTVTWKKLPGKE